MRDPHNSLLANVAEVTLASTVLRFLENVLVLRQNVNASAKMQIFYYAIFHKENTLITDTASFSFTTALRGLPASNVSDVYTVHTRPLAGDGTQVNILCLLHTPSAVVL